MKIHEASKKTGISKRNIHFYLKEHLITPKTNAANNYYDFDESDCQKLEIIHQLRNANCPISVIRSILNMPLSANFNLRSLLNYLTLQAEHLQQVNICLEKILYKLPFHSQFSDVYDAIMSVSIPEKPNFSSDENSFIDYRLVNDFLWRPYYPEHPTEYQQFLWEKLNRIAATYALPCYQKLYHYLCSLTQKERDSLYDNTGQRYRYLASLDAEGCATEARQIPDDIRQFLSNPVAIALWKERYEKHFLPSIQAATSIPEIHQIALDMSELLRAESKNINRIYGILQEWLATTEGRTLLSDVLQTLQVYFLSDDIPAMFESIIAINIHLKSQQKKRK